MAFRGRTDDGLLLVIFGSSPLKTQKVVRVAELDPLLQTFLDPRMLCSVSYFATNAIHHIYINCWFPVYRWSVM